MKRILGEVVTDLDPSKRMNFTSSVLGEIPKLMDFGLSPVNATGKPNSVLAPSTRAERLNGTGGSRLNGNWLESSHGAEVAVKRVSETKAYSNHIEQSELETKKVFERENIQTENTPLTRQPDFVTPLTENIPQTQSTEISKNKKRARTR